MIGCETGNTSGWTGLGLAAYTYAAANGSYGLQLTNPENYAEQTITGLSPNTSYLITSMRKASRVQAKATFMSKITAVHRLTKM